MSKLVMRSLTLTAGEVKPVKEVASFFMLVSNTGTLKIQIRIDNDPFSDFPVGYEYLEKKDDHFNQVTFKNPNAGSVTIEYILSTGLVRSSPSITALDSILDAVQIANDLTTLYSYTILDQLYLIDVAAAVDKGGGKVGIPVTNNPFTGGTELIIIQGTVNYNGTYTVDPISGENEVVIVSAFVAETFDGVNDKIGLEIPRFIPADTTQKEIIFQNNGAVEVWFGDATINPVAYKGTKLVPGAIMVLTLTDAIYFIAVGAGKGGAKVSPNRLRRT